MGKGEDGDGTLTIGFTFHDDGRPKWLIEVGHTHLKIAPEFGGIDTITLMIPFSDLEKLAFTYTLNDGSFAPKLNHLL